MVSFGINSGAYVSEVIRGGILSVDKGQSEAGRSLGLGYKDTMRFIIIPQAVKTILPAMGNEFIQLIKETSILGYVGIMDLTKAESCHCKSPGNESAGTAVRRTNLSP